MADKHDQDWQTEHDFAVAPSKPDLKQPPKYRVIMMNDDYTPMDFVVEVLETLFDMGRERATRTMLQVHSYAQRHGHPLQCTMEQE